MSSRYSQIRIAMNIFEEVARLAPAGSDGDRFEVFISFEGDLPIPVPDFKTAPRVIVTPVRQLPKDGEKFNLVTPIGAARDVTAKGFRLSVCSQDPDFGGLTSFNWVAIEESPDSANPVPDLITGVLPPMFFGPFRQRFGSNRTFEDHGFGGFGLFDSSVGPVLLTATDHNVQGHSVAAVGMVDNSEDPKPRHDMLAHNVDISAGGCAFNWATFSLEKHFDPASAKGALEPAVETGGLRRRGLRPVGKGRLEYMGRYLQGSIC
jgi:hypothetical protein